MSPFNSKKKKFFSSFHIRRSDTRAAFQYTVDEFAVASHQDLPNHTIRVVPHEPQAMKSDRPVIDAAASALLDDTVTTPGNAFPAKKVAFGSAQILRHRTEAFESRLQYHSTFPALSSIF
ncbi:hypothetical protein P8C59_003632 [Phyllachora maydis]|uniref:Uncharacterized protein n=1 Tax=Phyllachora maydis TaxID=1825666 RepID=A0AAD9I1T6_9PEZI|nr:hypothetical protein P8C59_003632 [Phyllachora maydis]